MKVYEKPEILLVELAVEDVIAASGELDPGRDGLGFA